MGQSLPSMGERYFLKNLIRAADAFAGLVALSREMSLASGPCHGPFIGSSWATAMAADTTRRAVRIVVSLFIRKGRKRLRSPLAAGIFKPVGETAERHRLLPPRSVWRPRALKHQLMSNQGSRQDQAQGEMGLDGQGLGRDDLVIGLVVKVQDLHGL